MVSGISLKVDQWEALKSYMDAIDGEIVKAEATK
tara:strand:+ start:125 stop:226 length:102 start_codon:yes stop_codon:yes gene_type:complete